MPFCCSGGAVLLTAIVSGSLNLINTSCGVAAWPWVDVFLFP